MSQSVSTRELPAIFDYLDVAKYVRDYYETRHSIDRWFSYRYIQSKTSIDPGYLFKVFQGKKPLPTKKVPLLAKTFGLSKSESDYFKLLALYCKAKSNDEIKFYFDKMLSYRELIARKVELKEYEYYSKWYYAAIRQILSYYPFRGDYTALAKMTVPAITAAEAKKAVKLLCNLGFVKKDDDETYRLTDRFLTTGKEWYSIAVRTFQQETMMLALKSLDTIDKKLRDVSTVTAVLSKEGFQEARELITQFRHDILDLADRQENAHGAYHINVQLIPIARQWDGEQE